MVEVLWERNDVWLDHKLDKWRAEANILFACLGVSSDHQELLYVTRCYCVSQHWEGEEKYLPAQEVKSFSDQNSSLVVPTIYDEAVSNYNPKLRLKLPVPSIVFLGSTLCNPLVSFPSQYQVKNIIYIRTNNVHDRQYMYLEGVDISLSKVENIPNYKNFSIWSIWKIYYLEHCVITFYSAIYVI